MNALTFDTVGTLYGVDYRTNSLYRINTSTGAAFLVGTGSYISGGDLAFFNGELLLTQTNDEFAGVQNDSIFSINTKDGTGRDYGPTKAPSIYGLATSNGELYGATGNKIHTIDYNSLDFTNTVTHSSSELSKPIGSAFYTESGAEL